MEATHHSSQPSTNTEANPGRLARFPASRKRRLLFATIYLTYLAGLAWLGVSLYLYFMYRVPPTLSGRSLDINQVYYPELIRSGVLQAADEPDKFNVMLIGGSTLEQTGDEWQTELRRKWGPDVRVFNLAKSAHTSRDSLIKFQRLPPDSVDLVVLYDGFNDIRMNCVPEADYRDDYTHCGWYFQLEKHLRVGHMSLGQVLQRDVSSVRRLYELGIVSPELLDEGATVKTKAAFRNNVAGVLDLCAARRIPVILMTFAAFIPEDYTRDAFFAGKLSYGDGGYRMDAESWGRPENIRRTLAAHNAAINSLSEDPAYQGIVRFIDQEQEVPASGVYFSDPCHFTPAGIRRFVENVLRHCPERPRSRPLPNDCFLLPDYRGFSNAIFASNSNIRGPREAVGSSPRGSRPSSVSRCSARSGGQRCSCWATNF